ncbi:hypothetical protein E6P09_06095 [Haloferax mediterranei ATCC 33500]|uniref:Uncharacterized protein n=1 Tax=Haloferax mediterranei (strain ATCC 33500 / DSM 1411 / JCM 8866 / NBRC 14739 / NCIMB 2177 / R-4) TaxID=523841 RepID=I3R276_HALMT|nr:hypothetical protein [Haloferax mediterranei]AFK18336.1 hypothetical protein HFX_0611 [Haloferax mediterranei ATCC 33500]AHZ22268.1 hypothetical protein BM92_06205 [Haloferax mediterranei ATCC 33500]EMA02394.1 hypothetical protein C439_07425 [Haloferax mediterranei ATCC 33500]MDX5988424.1 hypothetical protein [Haloferax mediterranei ATCC 33500]QCQ74848.1 hypothetical protein E6P09_06095 [Haloferax mediterranei ATCC 33500]
MTKTRTLALVVGVLATTAGLAIIAGVSLGLELTDLFLGLVAALAALQGLRYVQRRRDTSYKTTTTDDPEMRVSVPVPGVDFDDEIAAAMTRRKRWAARSRVVDRLESRARQALVLRGGRTPAEAETLLDSGAWTDDVVAARFLGAEASLPLRRRLRLLLSGQSMFAERVDRTVAAISNIGNESAQTSLDETGSVTVDETGGEHP